MKFIKVTRYVHNELPKEPLLLNITQIVSVVPIASSNVGKTAIKVTSGTLYHVNESVEQVMEMLCE